MKTLSSLTKYAHREKFLRPSPVRSIWDVSMAEDMISLAGGNPDISGLPLDEIGKKADELIRSQGLEVLQYGAGSGLTQLREEVTKLMTRIGIQASADDVLITSGSQMGLELVTAMYCNPDDVILVESPTYVGAINTFKGLEVAVEHVACDGDGILPESLEARIAELRAAGKAIKLLYTIPNFNNPSGVTLSESRRKRIVEICTKAGIVIVEDDPYGLIRFSGEQLAAIRSLDSHTIYLGSMSKIFSPGIRVGWVLAPHETRARLQLLSEATTIHASVLSQYLAFEYLHSLAWEKHLEDAIKCYQQRAYALLDGLENIDGVLPEGSTWTRPSGGFFVWVTLPEGYSSNELLDLAIKEKVVFIAGDAFFADCNSGARNLRLSFSLESPENIREGLRRLARASQRLVNDRL